MKAILLLAGPYSSCDATKHIWQDICEKNNIDFESYEASNEAGREIALKHNIKSFPALIINEKVVAVGHPDEKSSARIFEAVLK